MKLSDFLIQHECPQCGAPAILEETDRLFQCEYCRVRSYLVEKDFFRYTLPHKASEDKEIIYFPYWRFRGTLFSCFAKEIGKKFTDISYPAADFQGLPMSLGLRTQALKLRFLSSDTQGRFVKPGLPIGKVTEFFRQKINESAEELPLYQRLIGYTLSMIYAPFYILDGVWYDAVLNEEMPLSSIPEPVYHQPDSQIDFIPALCPNCGWNLDGDRNTLTLTCTGCQSVWYAQGKRLIRLSYATIMADGDNIVWMPFWRIEAKISGVKLDSYTDLIRLANLPKVASESSDATQLYFWVPAFKVLPAAFLRLSRGMIVAQPQEEMISRLPKGMLYAVTLPHTEAISSIKIHLAGLIKPGKMLREILRQIRIKASKAMLVYVPFYEGNSELIQPDYLLSAHKSPSVPSKPIQNRIRNEYGEDNE